MGIISAIPLGITMLLSIMFLAALSESGLNLKARRLLEFFFGFTYVGSMFWIAVILATAEANLPMEGLAVLFVLLSFLSSIKGLSNVPQNVLVKRKEVT